MTSDDRRRLGTARTSGSNPPDKGGHDGQNSSGWTLNRACNSLLNWFLWILVIGACGGLATGLVSRNGRRNLGADRVLDAGPIRRDIVRYSAQFLTAVKTAPRDRRDFLENYEVFRAIWAEVSPNRPMMVKHISPACADPGSKKFLPALDGDTVAIQATNFAEQLPKLEEIRTLILEGDGTGRGRLARSGYEAEPADLNETAKPQVVK